MKLLLDTHIFLWFLHRDPFDRLLICQSWQHNLTILTADEAVMSYQMAQFLK